MELFDEHFNLLITEGLKGCLINLFSNKSQVRCDLCKNLTLRIDCETGIILPIAAENIAAEIKLVPNELLEKLTINNVTYRLFGFIEFSGKKGNLGHYKSYSCLGNSWELRNDLKMDQIPETFKKLPNLFDISLLIYSRCDNLHDRETSNLGTVKKAPISKNNNLLCLIHADKCEPPNKYFKINQERFILTNTCPYDSLFELFTVAYQMSHIFKQCTLIALKSKEMNILKSVYSNEESYNSSDPYKDRFEIMLAIGKKYTNKKPCVLDCDYNVAKLFTQLFENHCNSYKICSSCKNKETWTLVVISIPITDIKKGFSNLNAAINKEIGKKKYCENCNFIQIHQFSFDYCLTIDIEDSFRTSIHN